MPSSKGLGMFTGQTCWQSPQPVHLSTLTYLGFCRTRTLKFPTKPVTSVTSDLVRISMFRWRPTSLVFGVRIQPEQSRVGKVLSNWAIFPPIISSFSIMNTLYPAFAIFRAAVIPAMPPPTTMATGFTDLVEPVRGSWCNTLAMPPLIKSLALRVAPSGLSETHEQCSRILTISKRYGFIPAEETAFLKVGSCILGEHEASTT